jgi:tRNA(fMet)-specific endonuclease VapC
MIVFDSDIFTLFAYGHEKVKKRYDEADDVFAVTVITWIEVLKGRTDSMLKAANEKELRVAAERMRHTVTVLNDFAVLPVDDAAVAQFGKPLRHKKLAKRRRADMLVACIALGCQARLVTRNLKDFKDVPGARLENWAD